MKDKYRTVRTHISLAINELNSALDEMNDDKTNLEDYTTRLYYDEIVDALDNLEYAIKGLREEQ